MINYSSSAMWRRVALPFAVLVALGSLVVVAIQHRSYEQDAREELKALAEANADFLRRTAVTPTEGLARDLGRMVNAEVFFGRGEVWIPAADPDRTRGLARLEAGAAPVRRGRGGLAVAVRAGDYDLALVRPALSLAAVLRMPSVLFSLGVFWLTALGLAGLVTQGVVRPLRALAHALPGLSDPGAPAPSLPGVSRSDEIGLVARTYLKTHAQLNEERARRQQAERLAVLARVSTGLAHEIRNPVAAIRMHAQLLQERSTAAADAASAGHIVTAANRIESLVRQWLFLARPEAPQRGRVRLRALVAGRLEELAPALGHAGLEVVVTVPQDCVVFADAARLGQVVENLLLNGAQAVAGAGRLEIAAEAAPGRVRISFRDTGPGFSPEALRRGTELFFSEREGGMGVGLSVCDEIVRAHGGALQLANDPRGGARVTFELPVETEGAP